MQPQGNRSQGRRDFLYDASGVSTGSAQLILPEAKSRSLLLFQNVSDTAMYLEIGSARAYASLTSGVVTSVTVSNAGFNFTIPPIVSFYGGGQIEGNSSPATGCTLPDWPSPSNVAAAHCVLATKAVSSIVIDNGGSGYLIAPFVHITNSYFDPNGCAVPSATSGYYLPASTITPLRFDTSCPTEAVALYCASSSKAFVCKFMY